MHRIKTLTKRNTMNLSLDELDPNWLNPILRGCGLPSPCREQALLRLSQLLPVVASDQVAPRQAPAADLETDQATVLGAPLDQPRRHEARVAR